MAKERGGEARSRQDQQLAEALVDSTTRLLSTAWLCDRPRGFVLSRRQDLPEEAFVPGEKAARLLLTSERRVGALSYGWLTPLHSDPHGSNAAFVLDFLRTEDGRRISALFWDFASMPQKDEQGKRTESEGALFGRGIKWATWPHLLKPAAHR